MEDVCCPANSNAIMSPAHVTLQFARGTRTCDLDVRVASAVLVHSIHEDLQHIVVLHAWMGQPLFHHGAENFNHSFASLRN